MNSRGEDSRSNIYSLDEGGLNFKERQREHFNRILHLKWECNQPGHTVCVPTDDGQHWSLTDRHIKDWINEIISGKGTTAEPSHGTFEDIGKGAVRNRRNGTMTVKAVSISPARQRDGFHSLRSFLRGGSNAGSAHVGRSLSLTTQAATESTTSTISRGPGSLTGKGRRWLGEEALAATWPGIEHILCFRACWRNIFLEIGPAERRTLSEMLEAALEMSKPRFSRKINKLAFNIVEEAQTWLRNDLPHTPENVLLLLQVRICMISLKLTSNQYPLATDLAWELLEALTRAPSSLIDGSPSLKQQSVSHEDTPAIAIRLIARELAYSKFAMQHPWLGANLLNIVEMTLEIRPLSDSELSVIWELTLRRTEQSVANMITDSRSWEVVLFAHCANLCSDFKEAILQPTGFLHLIESLENSFAHSVRTENIQWEDAILTVRSLAFLAEHDWIVESDVMNERALAAILAVFRRDVPVQSLSLHYWATRTLCNIVTRRPGVVRILVNQGILIVLSRIIPSISSPSQAYVQQAYVPFLCQRSLNRSVEIPGDDDLRETVKFAKELSVHVNKYMTWTPDVLPRPVSVEESVWELTL